MICNGGLKMGLRKKTALISLLLVGFFISAPFTAFAVIFVPPDFGENVENFSLLDEFTTHYGKFEDIFSDVFTSEEYVRYMDSDSVTLEQLKTSMGGASSRDIYMVLLKYYEYGYNEDAGKYLRLNDIPRYELIYADNYFTIFNVKLYFKSGSENNRLYAQSDITQNVTRKSFGPRSVISTSQYTSTTPASYLTFNRPGQSLIDDFWHQVDINSTPNDPDNDIYVTSSTDFILNPKLFWDYEIENDSLLVHTQNYKRVQVLWEKNGRLLPLYAVNYDDIESKKEISMIPSMYANRQHFNNINTFKIHVYAWTVEDFERDNPATAMPEGYSIRLSPVQVYFSSTPDTCPEGYNCFGSDDPNKWVPDNYDDGYPTIPERPDNDWDILGWLRYIVEWIIYIIEVIVHLIKQLSGLIVEWFSGFTVFAQLLRNIFGFLPEEIVSVMILAVVSTAVISLIKFIRR